MKKIKCLQRMFLTLAQHLIKDYPKVLDTAKSLKRIPSRKREVWNVELELDVKGLS